MRRRSFVAGVGALACTSASALSFWLDFKSVIQRSAAVAWVEVESGRTILSTDGVKCGANYVGRVLRSIKGVGEGDRLNFGYFLGHRVGTQYFVFLEDRARVLRNTSPGEVPPMMSPVPYVESCRQTLPEFVEIAEGLGTIPVEAGEFVGYKPAVSLSSPPYEIPQSLVAGRRHTGQVMDGLLLGSVQVEAEAFLEYLRSLA